MASIFISRTVSIGEEEVAMTAIRAQGSGGQNVNKVSTAIHLRFDIVGSSLPEHYKEALLALNDSRITKEGVWIIKSQEHSTQELNKQAALMRLQAFIQQAGVQKKHASPPNRAAAPAINAWTVKPREARQKH